MFIWIVRHLIVTRLRKNVRRRDKYWRCILTLYSHRVVIHFIFWKLMSFSTFRLYISLQSDQKFRNVDSLSQFLKPKQQKNVVRYMYYQVATEIWQYQCKCHKLNLSLLLYSWRWIMKQVQKYYVRGMPLKAIVVDCRRQSARQSFSPQQQVVVKRTN